MRRLTEELEHSYEEAQGVEDEDEERVTSATRASGGSCRRTTRSQGEVDASISADLVSGEGDASISADLVSGEGTPRSQPISSQV